GVAIKFGFSHEVRAAAGVDLEAAGAQAGGDGGDAQADVVDAFADGVAGGAELFHFGPASGIGVPHHAFRQRLDVFVQRRLAQVALIVNPQHVVSVEDAPDSRERIAP